MIETLVRNIPEGKDSFKGKNNSRGTFVRVHGNDTALDQGQDQQPPGGAETFVAVSASGSYPQGTAGKGRKQAS